MDQQFMYMRKFEEHHLMGSMKWLFAHAIVMKPFKIIIQIIFPKA